MLRSHDEAVCCHLQTHLLDRTSCSELLVYTVMDTCLLVHLLGYSQRCAVDAGTASKKASLQGAEGVRFAELAIFLVSFEAHCAGILNCRYDEMLELREWLNWMPDQRERQGWTNG